MRPRVRRTRGLDRPSSIVLAIILTVAAIAPAFLLSTTPTERPAAPPHRAEPVQPPQKTENRVVAQPDAESYVLQPPYAIEDGLTFGPEKAVRTRLTGLEGPSAQAACLDRTGLPWACGLAARVALHDAIRVRPITCRPVQARGAVQLATCTNEAGDLGRQLVLQGFARPADGLDTPEAKTAREAEAGLWKGGWRLKR